VKVRDVLSKDPVKHQILNNGVAEIRTIQGQRELQTLRYELETFVCEGHYQQGLARILDTYLKNLNNPVQVAAWISGFFGSGKSHLAKMLRALWIDFTFPEDGATARGIANLPQNVEDLLRELTAAGKRYGGLHAAGGTLSAGGGDSVRLAFLGVLYGSLGLPEKYAHARFVLWLRRQGIEPQVRDAVAARGANFEEELSDLYVSDVLAEALLEAKPGFAPSPADALQAILAQFPQVKEISNADFDRAVREALARGGVLPCTVVVLDEVQQFIGENTQRSIDVQEVVEYVCNKFDSKILIVGTGQMALNSTALLQRLQARFKIPVTLSDTDVEAVIRKNVLAKRPDRASDVHDVLQRHAGEISRHLANTRIAPTTADEANLVPDYPLLPARRRFWERVLRAVDQEGTTGQLRTQLAVVHEGVREIAERRLGWVVPADYLYTNLSDRFLTSGVLLREVHDDIIARQRDGTPDGELRARLCALAFLIGKLPREQGSDIGVRATPDALADLLVEDLEHDGNALRMKVPGLLEEMVAKNFLIQVEGEYRLQTKESANWNNEYQVRYGKLVNDDQRMAHERADRIREEASARIGGVKLPHGRSKVQRRVQLFFGRDAPQPSGQGVPVWVRDGWEEEEKSVVADARQAGTSSPLVFVFVPKRGADELRSAIASLLASTEVLATRPMPTTREGIEAREAMVTRQREAEIRVAGALESIFGGAQTYLAGGDPYHGLTLDAAVKGAAEAALARLFPQFDTGDDPAWARVIQRAKQGDGGALEALGYKGDVEKHPVCSTILTQLGAGKRGADLRKGFGAEPYGWPQDTVDGALLVLHLAEHVRASVNGAPVQPRQLDQAKIGPAEFRAEQVFVSTPQKIALRQLFQEAGVSCKPGEEAAMAPAFVARALELASQAGGDAPAPLRPTAPRLLQVRGLSGNDQLLELFNERDALKSSLAEWKAASQKIEVRLPRWNRLQELLRLAKGLGVADEVAPQSRAIAEQRRLLDEPDPVPPLADRVTQRLREELTNVLADYAAVYDREMKALEASATWQRLTDEKKAAILKDCGIQPPAEVRTGTEDEVVRALGATPLDTWRARRDALPTRFQQALERAAKLLEPKAVKVALPSATIRDEVELKAWIDTVHARIKQHLDERVPVIV
jgi:hypothetical protein